MKFMEVDISVPSGSDLLEEVVNHLSSHMKSHGTFPTLPELGAALNLSVRSLQRRLLNNDNLSYVLIVDQLRKSLIAFHIVRDISLLEVSTAVGFSGYASFNRFVNSQWGMTPQELRKEITRLTISHLSEDDLCYVTTSR
ncbi:helix-turn-helix domain-containing protein [Cellvibrio sp. QJXJ]|uniref:helix-turn-helix domain-containing protein n=1 Tax=Cellvibrio sp. QJXJ TaxID=2964606 RepID=UPI0021C36977|nr:helix-turn-helix domain-containing protein [Cellvibrio sp. QJXJ]UUA75162.1 helix-turn-helix domain-containing protein [Cellvibrio sp. QJXJ]